MRWRIPVMVVPILALLGSSMWGTSPASASTSYTFSFVGANPSAGLVQTWTVPAGVDSIFITARGGDGAGDTMPLTDPRKYGGHGAVVTMTSPVTVTPGATLSIYVAGQGDPGRGCNCAGKGGWGYASGGQGGSGYAGGGGGGATAVVSDLDGLLIVAGGGGGAGSAVGADGGTAAEGGIADGGDGLTSGAGTGGAGGSGGAAGAAVSLGVDPTAGLAIGSGGTGGAGAYRSVGSRSFPFGGGGGGGYGGGGGGGGTGNGAGGGAGGSFSAVTATYAPSTLPWSSGDLRYGNAGEVVITVPSTLEPTFDSPVPTQGGFTVNVTNFDDSWAWSATSSAGSVVVGAASGTVLPLTVTGLSPGEAATVSVSNSRSLWLPGSASVVGGSRSEPPPVYPPSPPGDTSAVADDGSARVSWAPPTFSGTFAVTHYQAMASPGGRVCLTSGLSCTVSGLTNGTSYTFQVRALNGAGWGPWSAVSNVVTPEAPVVPSIVISGSREGRVISVSGSSTGLGMGAILKPWLRRAGESGFTQRKAEILVSMDGAFTWQVNSRKKVSVYVATPDGSLESNRVRIR